MTGIAGALAAACGDGSPVRHPTPASALASVSAALPAEPRSPGLQFDITAVDARVDPCVDFYDYACGNWRATHPVPPDRTKWSRFAEMMQVNVERERSLIEAAAKAGPGATAAEQRVGAFYSACMDQAGIDARGLAPLAETFAAINGIRTAKDASRVLADLHAHDLQVAFSLVPQTDPRDTKQVIAWIDKGGLGLPEVGDYTKTDEAAVKRRGQYTDYLTRLFQLLGDSEDDAKAAAKRTLAFETPLAEKALSRVERRKRENLDHPMTAAELSKRYPSIDWRAYFTTLGLPALERVNVAQPAWADALEKILASNDLAGLRDYLRMRVARAQSRVLPSAIEAEVFDFNQRTLRGAKDMAPRAERCIELVDEAVGDDVGRMFVSKFFDETTRARVASMIRALIDAYRTDIDGSDWLGAPAREAAKAKLAKMLVVTGMSNRPRVFDGLELRPDDAFGNVWRAQAFLVSQETAKVGAPTDRETFFDSLPQSTDGFGSKTLNATGFTAGFLQPPVFDPQMDDAINFGGLGSVIGHELSHQLDDEGRKYDAEGNQRDWWAADDVARFKERAQCFIDEYSAFHIEDGTPVDGKLTLGENIADNGGIRLSYAALHPSETGPKIDGYTPAQRFFLAWGQIRCENVTPERAKQLVASDEHSPGRWRVDGVVANMPEFASAFSCKAGAPMAPEKRCAVW